MFGTVWRKQLRLSGFGGTSCKTKVIVEVLTVGQTAKQVVGWVFLSEDAETAEDYREWIVRCVIYV
mgnify:CR=1 FL=1